MPRGFRNYVCGDGLRVAVLSIDLGGSHIGCAVVEGDAILAELELPTSAGSLAGNLDRITEGLWHVAVRSGVRQRSLQGIAIGFCGIVDGSTGEILSTLDKYADATSQDLRAWAQREFGLPVRIENDACLALLGESFAGAARGARDVVMVTLGTGIGGAAMLEGRLLRSSAGQAGCLGGHLPVNFRGRLCSCGAVGCAEAEASTAVLPLLCHEHPGFPKSLLAQESELDFATVYRAADAGDTVAADIVVHCEQVWAALTVGLIHAYGPELVLFGGGVLQRGCRLLEPIRRYVEKHMWRTSRGVPRIESAALGSRAALLGGAALFGVDRQRGGGSVHAI